MGCAHSVSYHKSEQALFIKDMPVHKLLPQSADVFADLETDNDMKGQIAVDHIFVNTRDAYGQPSVDLESQNIDWANQYNIVFSDRPSPYDFPAFADEKCKSKNM
ncbi:unnamed protein product [Bursaphelenchus xylophilus]|uniref:(pine wood nematode) hypothetical protein n=1 Tax=Bursaphelenchus xylophilus TaxID=6326 RepID=A0A1I7RNH0_BURXY|nr:unnamed protein product [Bursaphelenchus xylophilus]CAG9124006.1 unnamed protein product [Bursaphelenchus xylophilus]